MGSLFGDLTNIVTRWSIFCCVVCAPVIFLRNNLVVKLFTSWFFYYFFVLKCPRTVLPFPSSQKLCKCSRNQAYESNIRKLFLTFHLKWTMKSNVLISWLQRQHVTLHCPMNGKWTPVKTTDTWQNENHTIWTLIHASTEKVGVHSFHPRRILIHTNWSHWGEFVLVCSIDQMSSERSNRFLTKQEHISVCIGPH